jgi:hypothetical protein
LVVREFLTGKGLAQQGDGVQNLLGADVGSDLTCRGGGLEQGRDNGLLSPALVDSGLRRRDVSERAAA